jgi:glycosyltransferase involved in cell wall biosynthesis
LYNRLHKTFTVSQAGLDYLAALGVARERTALARLGIEDPDFLSQPSRDGVLRLVSCSFIVPVKRVPLLAQGVVAYAHRHRSTRIQWTHLGDGDQKERVLDEVGHPPANLRVEMLGHLDNREVLAFYERNCCDLFVHVSASEGLPVAMQEASAVGLPILASNVGGVAEIATPQNGRLLPANPTVHDIVRGLEWFSALSGRERMALREQARAVWARSFNAETNHSQFAQRLLESWQDGSCANHVD